MPDPKAATKSTSAAAVAAIPPPLAFATAMNLSGPMHLTLSNIFEVLLSQAPTSAKSGEYQAARAPHEREGARGQCGGVSMSSSCKLCCCAGCACTRVAPRRPCLPLQPGLTAVPHLHPLWSPVHHQPQHRLQLHRVIAAHPAAYTTGGYLLRRCSHPVQRTSPS